MGALDIAVAGCGPAGLAAALLLARDGHRVRLFERFDTPRPVGSGLMIQPAGLALLRRMGVAGHVQAAGAPIARLHGISQPGGRTALLVRYDWIDRASGIGIHRAALFDILFAEVCSAGIPIETGRTVAGSERDGEKRRLRFAGGGVSAGFDLIVDCLGSGSPLAPAKGRPLAYGALWASLDWPEGAGFDHAALEQRYRGARQMAGVLPIGRRDDSGERMAAFFWSLRADRLERWRAAGLDAWKEEVLALWPETAPLLAQIDGSEQLTFARYAHRTLRRPAEPGLIHLGDAWHSTSPQLGQGANMALLDAWALAAALRQEKELADALARAVRMRRRHVLVYQALSRLFTPAYQSDGAALPWLRDRIVAPLARIGPARHAQAAMVTGLFGWPLRPLGLEP